MYLPLTEEQAVVTRKRLAEAEQAWHDLQIGTQARVFVDQNGERIEYNPATRAGLRGYIMELRAALGLPPGSVGPLYARMVR
jgi:hypothetical protein